MKRLELKTAFLLAASLFAFSSLASLCAEDSVGSAKQVAGQKFERWTSAGDISLAKPEEPLSPATLSGKSGSITVTASFSTVPPPPSLLMKVKGKGSTSPAADSKIQFKEENGQQRVVAKPDKHSKFDGWELSGPVSLSDPAAIETLATVSGPNATITALFSAEKGWLSTGTWGGGTMTPAAGSSTLLDINAPLEINATPAAGYAFSKWQTSGDAKVAEPESAKSSVTLSGYNGHATAIFTGLLQNFSTPLDIDSHYKGASATDPVNLSIGVAGRGSTSPTAGPYVGSPCQFTIKATPASDSVFERWESSGRAHVVAPESAETVVYVFGNASLKAVFNPEFANLKAKAGQGGSLVEPVAENSKVKTSQPQRIAVKADSGWKFLKWTVNGGASIANVEAADTSITLKNNATAMAVFVRDYAKDGTQAKETKSASEGALGSLISFNSAGAISATPPEGYHFLVWRSTGVAKVADELSAASKLSFNGSGASTVSAVFMPNAAYLKIEVSGSGSTSPAAGQEPLKMKIGESITLSATPSQSATFSCWKASGGVKLDDLSKPSVSATVNSSGTATAVFVPAIVKLNVLCSGGGSVEPASASVQAGVPIQIEAKPLDGFKFQEWKTEGPVQLSTVKGQKSAATLSGDASATAVFAPEWATLTLAVSGDGKTEPESCRTMSVKPGSSVKINALPAIDSNFVSWSVQGQGELSDKSSASGSVKVEGGDVLVIAAMEKKAVDAAKKAQSSQTASELALDAAATSSASGSASGSSSSANGSPSSSSSASAAAESGWVSASDGAFSDRVRVSWSHPASLFEVWRKLDSEADSAYVKLIDSWPGQSYDDFSAAADTVYVYKVVAKSKTGAVVGASTDSGFKKK